MKKHIVSIIILIVIYTMSITLANEDRVSLGYIYNVSKSHTEIVNSTNGNINTVSPTCFDLTHNGRLLINNIFSQDFVNDMHAQNVLVTPFLSNHWGRKKAEAALKNPELLVNDVVEAVLKYNLDGVNVDIENILVKDKDKLTNFVKILREKMPEEKIVSVAVAANPNKFTKTWVAAYDYENLAKYSDYLVLMAYDEHSAGGAEGPVASIGFVEDSIKVILESVSRDKVVLGIPLYGRYWKKDTEQGGEAVIIAQVERIAKRYSSFVPVYDESTGTATLTIEVKDGDKKAYINGRYLEEGIYTIYYENEDSILRKLELMNQYGLKGAGLWALDNEYEEVWNYYGKGFYNTEYESEESVNERVFYEYVDKLVSEAETLKLVDILKFDNKLNYQLSKTSKPGKKCIEYLLKEKVKMAKMTQLEEKAVHKNRKYKKIEPISFSRVTRRVSKAG